MIIIKEIRWFNVIMNEKLKLSFKMLFFLNRKNVLLYVFFFEKVLFKIINYRFFFKKKFVWCVR